MQLRALQLFSCRPPGTQTLRRLIGEIKPSRFYFLMFGQLHEYSSLTPHIRPVLRSRGARWACAEPGLRSDYKHHPGLWRHFRLATDLGHQSLCTRHPTPGEKIHILWWMAYVCVLRITIYVSCCFSTQPVRARPPLLRRWKTHKRMLASVEVIEVADGPFVLTASADGAASLWTKDGDHMGRFGQEVLWNMSEPATYQRWGSWVTGGA